LRVSFWGNVGPTSVLSSRLAIKTLTTLEQEYPKSVTTLNILLLSPRYPESTFWNLDSSAGAFKNAKSTMAPLGLITVASYLPDDFNLRLVDRNVCEESESDWDWADVVFLSLMLSQTEDYRQCIARARTHGVGIGVGGPYTSAAPLEAATEADWVCEGEAEGVMDQLVDDLRADRRGRIYYGGNKTDLKNVMTPRYDLIEDADQYAIMPVQFSRGCPFACEFCDIIEIYGRVPRTKSPSQIMRELDGIKATGFRGGIFIVDDNFIGNRKRASEMLLELATWNRTNGAPFFYFTEASINLGDYPKLLLAMERANFIFVFIGIETPDPDLLRAAQKTQNTTGDLMERLATIRRHGIHVIAGMIVGFDGEDRHVFERQRAFIEESGIGIVTFGLLQALPNTQLSRRLQKEGRLLKGLPVSLNHTIEGMNFTPKTELTKREYLELQMEIIEDLYEPEAFFRRIVFAHLSIRRTSPHPAKLSNVISLMRMMYRLGWCVPQVRRPFWRTFFKVAMKNPSALAGFYYDCFHYFHLLDHRHQVRRGISDYLAAPSVGDVIDSCAESPAI
jgi:radical SAM superfamily enzyme YgiQ (UPF0313 family)